MNKEEFKKILKDANEIKKLQSQNGNYNYDSYMLGLYNGMEMIISMFEEREPTFKNSRNINFLNDKSTNLKQALNEIRKFINTFHILQRSTYENQHILQIIDKYMKEDD